MKRTMYYPCVVRALAYVLCGIAGGVMFPTMMKGQSGTADAASAVLHELLVSLLHAEFPAFHAVDWSHYTHSDECINVPEWARSEAIFDSLDRTTTLDVNFRHDTTIPQSWAAVPERARKMLFQCLQRFPLSSIPGIEEPDFLQLGVWMNADTLMNSLMTKRLAATHGTPAEADTLNSMVNVLMASPGLPGQPVAAAPSPTHLKLAQAYAAQIGTLGPPGQFLSIVADGRTLDPQITSYDTDVMQQWGKTELDRSLQLPDTVIQQVGYGARDTMVTQLQGGREWLRWLTTGAPDALTKFRDAATRSRRLSALHLPLLGIAAPKVTGDFCFAASTASTATPATGASTTVPVPGVPNIVVFDQLDGITDGNVFTKLATFRKLHQEFPDVRFVLIEVLTDVVQSRWLQGNPAQEAALRRQLLTDSLGLPASICFLDPKYQTASNGWVLPVGEQLQKSYDIDVGEDGAFLVDPQGSIVEGDGIDYHKYRMLLHRWYQQNPTKTNPTP